MIGAWLALTLFGDFAAGQVHGFQRSPEVVAVGPETAVDQCPSGRARASPGSYKPGSELQASVQTADAELGYITQMTCRMPECLCPEELGGACYFEPVAAEDTDWMPTPTSISQSQSEKGP